MSSIELVIDGRRKDLGGFEVERILPYAPRRMVGPFIFFDHMGPAEFQPGFPKTVDVRPHPHIGLSTLTYLFDGEITHRDSLGAHQPIRPGEVNWMTAGRGITHSERFDPGLGRPARTRGRVRAGVRALRRGRRPELPKRRSSRAARRRIGLWRDLAGQGPLAAVLRPLAPGRRSPRRPAAGISGARGLCGLGDRGDRRPDDRGRTHGGVRPGPDHRVSRRHRRRDHAARRRARGPSSDRVELRRLDPRTAGGGRPAPCGRRDTAHRR